jgi:hypothetical protein
MDFKTMEEMKERIWFWKDSKWPSKPESMNPSNRYEKIQGRIREVIENIKKCKKGMKFYSPVYYIILVHTPFTFGHSQLVMKFYGDKQPDEPSRFRLATPIIEKALFVFQQVFNSGRITNDFENLKKVTLTEGHYIKTLVLRASANEISNVEHPKYKDHTEYKVHLVPYFRSHEERCKERYDSIHAVYNSKENGGLLGWLGTRETILDSWQLKNDNPFMCDLNKIAINCWKLQELAKILCRKFPSVD